MVREGRGSWLEGSTEEVPCKQHEGREELQLAQVAGGDPGQKASLTQGVEGCRRSGGMSCAGSREGRRLQAEALLFL